MDSSIVLASVLHHPSRDKLQRNMTFFYASASLEGAPETVDVGWHGDVTASPCLLGPKGLGFAFISAHTYKFSPLEKFLFLSGSCHGFQASLLSVPWSPGSKWVLRHLNISTLPFPSWLLSCLLHLCPFPQDTSQLESLSSPDVGS